jgi:alpha-beta hydrolase superfamily lysophospholipase
MRTPAWAPDTALPGFEAVTLPLPADAEGPVVATLVRRRGPRSSRRAVLYLHGFIDYFFQAHTAEAFNAYGYDFYALDLRKYGRSLRPHQTPNFCCDLREYFAEIDAALDIICGPERQRWLLLSGHSTGGLTAALYANSGARRAKIDALFLNSPFLDLNLSRAERALARVVTRLGARFPKLPLGAAISPLYAQSVHHSERGEWHFELQWKPIAGFPAYAGWLRAIALAQRELQAGLAVACPVLLMHSARSLRAKRWADELLRADAVLDVEHMRRFGPGIGRDVTLIAVDDGMHDLMLSALPVRAKVFQELFAWLARLQATKAEVSHPRPSA